MRHVHLAAVLLFSVALAPSTSHVRAQTLSVGDRARIALREPQRQDEEMGQRRFLLRGTVTSLRADTVFLQIPGTAGEVGVPRATALSVHRSLGVRSRGVSALRSGLGAAVVGALYFGLSYTDRNDFGVGNRGEAFALGAGVGAVTGAVLGALFPTERWQRIRH